jgi:Ser/Thr protein kinase RdoA (MazF antagonist)
MRMEPVERGELLGSGRMADVYALDERRVLRRYRDGTDASGEAAVMAHVAAYGYPVPAVFPAPEGARRSDLVLRRLDGPTMVAAILAGELTAERAGEMLAGLLHTLHRIPARLSRDPAVRVLHLDLHPENVLLTPDGPMVIDWANADEGPPGFDWAVSALILAEVAVGAVVTHRDLAPANDARAAAGPQTTTTPARGRAGLAETAREALTALLAHADLADLGDLAGWAGHCERARALRAANPTLAPEEKALLGEATELVRSLSPGAGSSGPGRR